ncbi:DUF2071 domain-containing protein [Pragia fontium]|uniref:Uncharacterized conserved protein (COG2071) n=1 Tax=Pragia fontium DSM 5563 = ATCC 49100 TaxID=1122977 RepID=A0AAJ5BGL2_9GAMM|nr:DUF2071 domain-containing protein [Pragia fontium]SFC48322.1 Uncharacterized conserved protein (COG2071) [Pragia fontium DSM 5563 = ATCC 49100]SUB82327.1 Uncharacterized conserved protein [Pragia fontium]VEJ55178.1 Uncharacterized conserved protein [Pragia fontium]
MQAPQLFRDFLHPRPQPAGIDVICSLQHFSIITYAITPNRFEGLIPERFKLDTVVIDGQEKGLLSVVPFVDIDFTSAVYPFPKFTMGQTNYRIYVVDTLTEEKCVWFLGTTLDSWALFVPRLLWNLPWYSGDVSFDCEYSHQQARYLKYRMETRAEWAPARLELTQDVDDVISLPGFPDLESGMVYLTHPLTGFYYRRDGKLGSYRVWHQRLNVKPGRLGYACFGLLTRLGLVTEAEQQTPYSVLMEPLNEFTVYLPPRTID